MLRVTFIDEVGYLTYGPDAANVLFHVVNERHLRRRPMVFTTNKTLSEWGKVLHDEARGRHPGSSSGAWTLHLSRRTFRANASSELGRDLVNKVGTRQNFRN